MSTNHIQIGTLNDNSQDHSKHVTINVPAGTNVSELVRSFFSEPEDITPDTTPSDIFSHITQKCIAEKRVEAVEAEIRAACKGTAEGLWRTLWNNENLGYVVVQPVDATTLYRDIENHYGKLPYSDRQFRSARNKR